MLGLRIGPGSVAPVNSVRDTALFPPKGALESSQDGCVDWGRH